VLDDEQGWHALTSLQQTDVVAVKVGPFGKGLLG
jgi:hypothetical protein